MVDINVNTQPATGEYSTTSHGSARFTSVDYPSVTEHKFDWNSARGLDLKFRLKRAFQILEMLCYVVWGAIPDYINRKQPWERSNPRSLWGIEQRYEFQGTFGGEKIERYFETGAFGTLRSGTRPRGCPIRSRSGDPVKQYATAYHSEFFPLGSVYRISVPPATPEPEPDPFDPGGTLTEDPIAFPVGDPPLTNVLVRDSGEPIIEGGDPTPPTIYGNPSPELQELRSKYTGHQVFDPASSTEGERWTTREDVIVVYEQPPNVQSVELLRLATYVVTADGSSGVLTGQDFVEVSPGRWESRISAREQGVGVTWYIQARFNEQPELQFEPQRSPEEPNINPIIFTDLENPEHEGPGHAYSFMFYTHYNPYRGGLPELNPLWKKGTDEYRFDESENIDAGLINLGRFTVEQLTVEFQHSPHLRPADLCCTYMPMGRFTHRWTGANKPWLYRRQDADPTQRGPLTNAPWHEDHGSESARRTWRGMPYAWYFDTAFFANNVYVDHGNESWLRWPDKIFLEPDPLNPPNEAFIRDYGRRGILRDDEIDPAHVEELIDAIDYINDHGLWKTERYSSMRRTSDFTEGLGRCGFYSHTVEIDGEMQGEGGFYDGCELCCMACSGYMDDSPTAFCTPWPQPTWEECYGTNAVCPVNKEHYFDCGTFEGGELSYCEKRITIDCDYLDGVGGSPLGGHVNDTYWAYCAPGDVLLQNRRTAQGANFWFCGPKKFSGGPDRDHGNGFGKERKNANNDPAGYPFSMGNSYAAGSVTVCEQHRPSFTPDFETVGAVWSSGIAAHWLDAAPLCCSIGQDWDYLGALELGIWHADGETPLCTLGDPVSCPPGSQQTFITQRICDVNAIAEGFLNCTRSECFVAIDLNKDADGIPQLKPYDLDYPEAPFIPPNKLCLTHWDNDEC